VRRRHQRLCDQDGLDNHGGGPDNHGDGHEGHGDCHDSHADAHDHHRSDHDNGDNKDLGDHDDGRQRGNGHVGRDDDPDRGHADLNTT
jgi:hypothetical protein